MRIVNCLGLLLALALPAAAETQLVVVEEAGCIYCARWNAEIAPIWPKTEEGAIAPLRRVDLRDLPEDIAFASPPRLTPTFVVAIDGEERGRMEGYSGDEFFWFRVRRMMSSAGIDLEENP